jgi:predicted CXXCH cytochrome family protein
MSGCQRKVGRWVYGLLIFGLVTGPVLLSGCDPTTRHQVLSTLFDGVPEMPPPEQLCEDYVVRLEQEKADAAAGVLTETDAEATPAGSVHQPYADKLCRDCHDFESASGLVLPPEKLCLSCHVDFVTGVHVHGPVAVGDCMACHLPHDSRFASLLKNERSRVCSTCHREERLAASMHNEVMARQMTCVDCHDPHDSDAVYFLD